MRATTRLCSPSCAREAAHPSTSKRLHGLAYSLTLHDESGVRLLGFGNAHAIREGAEPGARTRIEHDHRHAGESART